MRVLEYVQTDVSGVRTLPCRKVCSLEQRVLQNAFDTSQRCDYIDTVVVELPQFAIVPL